MSVTGLRTACSVFGKTKDNKIIGLTFTTYEGNLYYDTGETTVRCKPGTVGALNGFNNVTAKLEHISQLIDLVNQQIPDTEKELSPYRLNQIWEGLSKVAFKENKDFKGEMCLEEDYYIWKAGTSRNQIWQWFDRYYPGGLQKHHPTIDM